MAIVAVFEFPGAFLGCHCTNTPYSVVVGPVIGLSARNTALRQGDGNRWP